MLSVKLFQCFQRLSDILSVRRFYIALFHHGVMKGGVYFFMSQQPLYLFDRHSFINGGCSHGPPELMRMHMINVTLFAHLFQHDLDPTGQQAFMGIPD